MNDVRVILVNGKHKGFALVSIEDFQMLNCHKWLLTKNGYVLRYVRIAEKQKRIPMHRFILGDPVGRKVDHKNGFPFDNTRRNVRACVHAQNIQNQRKQRRYTASQFKGVTWCNYTSRWRAKIKTGGKHFHLGRFNSEKERCFGLQ
jgi:hypothetical protein